VAIISESATPDAIRAKRYVFCTRSAQRQAVSRQVFRQSLETDLFTTAKLRLPDELKELRKPKTKVGTFKELAGAKVVLSS